VKAHVEVAGAKLRSFLVKKWMLANFKRTIPDFLFVVWFLGTRPVFGSFLLLTKSHHEAAAPFPTLLDRLGRWRLRSKLVQFEWFKLQFSNGCLSLFGSGKSNLVVVQTSFI
jgi:hypothetical protein